MKSSIKKQWVAALRSGDYKQGLGRLETVCGDEGSMYCCLGVLCDLAVKDGADVTRVVTVTVAGYDGENGVLPASVVKWAGLTDRVPTVSYNDMLTDMVRLNDGLEMSFDQIADLIDAQL